MMTRRLSRLSLAACLALCLVACDRPAADAPTAAEPTADEAAKSAPAEAKKAADKAPPAQETLVVYSGRGAVLVEPLIERFRKETGIEVKVRFGKTGPLAQQLATEAAQTEADVFFAQDSGYIGALAKAGHLAKLPAQVLSAVPEAYRAKDGSWVGVSGRARVLVYNPTKLKPADLPTGLAQLTDPKWKGKLGWAPSNASMQAHVSALRHVWGEDKTAAWLKGVQAQAPTVYPKNSPQVKAVSSGEIEVGWVNHYYLHKLKAADPGLVAANHSFAKGDAGNVLMLSGVAVSKYAKHPGAAELFVAFLLSRASQAYFASEVYEYPTRPNVPTHADVPALGDRFIDVDQAHLADIGATLAVLRDLGIQ